MRRKTMPTWLLACSLILTLPAALIAGTPEKPLDVVLLLENSQDLQADLPSIMQGLVPGDRVALFSFGKTSRRRVAFTEDLSQVGRVIHGMTSRIRIGAGFAPWRPRVETYPRVLRAIVEACKEFDSLGGTARRRTVVVVFASDDYSSEPKPEAVATALTKRGASIYAVAVRRRDPKLHYRNTAQTPPTTPGSKPVQGDLAPPADLTLKTLSGIAASAGGGATSARWDLSQVLENARR